MFRLFEKLLHPYPETEPPELPRTFFSFVWACTAGTRGYLLLMGVLLLFFLVHMAMLFLVGFVSHVRAMITGYIPKGRNAP